MRFHKLEEALEGRRDSAFIGVLQNAQKFFCGHVDRLPAIGDSISAKDFPRLPYATAAFEMLTERDSQPVIVLCAELPVGEQEIVVLMPFASFPVTGEWGFYYSLSLNRTTNEVGYQKNPQIETADHDGIFRQWAVTCAYELARFLRVLNCVNVATIDIPEPRALNSKRARNGKPPIYSYKTLVLKTRQQRLSSFGGGTHESPRVHLRRGHIKHRKTGDFWWQPCVVGDRKRGVVMKDYRADELVA